MSITATPASAFATFFVAAAALAPAGDILWERDFTTSHQAVGGYGCTTRVEDGICLGQATKGTHFFFLPEVDVPGPVLVRLRAQTAPDMRDRAELYYRTVEHDRWGMEQMVRFSLPHDGQWHEIAVALPRVSRLRQVRLSMGRGEGTFALDWVRIESNPYPREIAAAAARLPERVTLTDEVLEVEFVPATHAYTVLDQRSGRVWRSAAVPVGAVLTAVHREEDGEMLLSFWDPQAATVCRCRVSLPAPGTLRFALAPERSEAPLFALNAYPPMLTCDMDDGRLLFCDRSAGTYIPQSDATYGGSMLGVYGNTHCSDMPWIGVVDHTDGDGVMVLAETPFDAAFTLLPDAAGRHWPQVNWRESLDTFRYPRTVSYRFSASGGYVALAKAYRDIAEDQGRAVPLRAKVGRKPAVAFLPGAAVFWGATDATDFVREARCFGILRAVLGNAHHGLRDHDSLAALNAAGYITSMYDSFSDALPGETGHGRDNIEETALHRRPGAGPAQGWVDALHTYFTRSSGYALRALKIYVPQELEAYGTNGRFIDVDMAIDPREDWHPQHTFDRRQDIRNRRDAFAWLDGHDLVLGTEHGNDWGLEYVEYTEGGLGGPFWWLHSNPEGWSINPIRNAAGPDDYREEYLRYGAACDTRIPLWQLVYHDCVVSTWYWGDTAGIHADARPDLADRKDLFAILYGGTPLIWREHPGYGWKRSRDRLLRTVYDITPLHAALAFEEMVSHEFMSPDMVLQRTRFSGGYTVVVNFSDTPRPYDTVDRRVMLAPRGFLAEGPGLVHSRLLVDGVTLTQTQTAGFRRWVTPEQRRFEAVELDGEAVAFRVAPERWQLAVKTTASTTLDAAALTGWAGPLAIVELDAAGHAMRPVEAADARAVTLEQAADWRFFAVMPRSAADPVAAYPPGGDIEIGSAVHLFSPRPDAAIRYTLDGSDPDDASEVADSPVDVAAPVLLNAQAVVNGRPVGPVQSWSFRPVRTAFRSGLMRGGDAAKHVDVEVSGCRGLRVLVGHGGDDCWSDWAALGDARFILQDGTAVGRMSAP